MCRPGEGKTASLETLVGEQTCLDSHGADGKHATGKAVRQSDAENHILIVER